LIILDQQLLAEKHQAQKEERLEQASEALLDGMLARLSLTILSQKMWQKTEQQLKCM